MSARPGKEDTKDHLSSILQRRFAHAQHQKDFTAASLATEGGVSVVWFYELVGDEFIKLRARLPGPIVSRNTLVTKLRKRVAGLRTQLRELKAKYEASIKEKLAAAIRHIESLDAENRMLRERVAYLEKRLGEGKVVIFPNSQQESATPFEEQN